MMIMLLVKTVFWLKNIQNILYVINDEPIIDF